MVEKPIQNKKPWWQQKNCTVYSVYNPHVPIAAAQRARIMRVLRACDQACYFPNCTQTCTAGSSSVQLQAKEHSVN